MPPWRNRSRRRLQSTSAGSPRSCSTSLHGRKQFRTVGLFTAGGVALAVMTVVLALAQT
jgi:hypothetical protein